MVTSILGLIRRRRPRRPRLTAVALCGIATIGGGLWVRLGPIAPDLIDLGGSTSTVVVDRHGRPLYESLSSAGTRSISLDAAALPPLLVAATVSAEDRRFWSHPGLDAVSMVRALKHNLSERQIVEGGSTITQQTAKLLLNRKNPSRSRRYSAKLAEAVLALRLEHRLTKREILALYLNLAPYGNQITGASRASRAYFGCDPAMLTAAQAAFLSGLPQRPSGFNPYRNSKSAIARQRDVIRRMASAGAITAQQADEARAERLTFRRDTVPFSAPHFVEMVLSSPSAAKTARLETTLDAELQEEISGIIRSHRLTLARHGAANVAVVVLDNATAEWLAWEGSGDYFDTDHGGAINGPVTLRQPGSALKPFTYALAFDEGGWTPASVLPDIPSYFPTADAGVLYSPRNYDGRYRGPLLARRALAGSENVPAVALASEIGVPRLLRFLARAGLSTFDRNASYYGLGVTLGNAEVRLDELVSAYSAFARGGDWLQPTWTLDRSAPVAQGFRPARGSPEGLRYGRKGSPEGLRYGQKGSSDGLRYGRNGGRPRRTLVSPRTAFWITDVLSDPDAREYIFGRGGSLEFPFPVAVKTGTSQAYHDNWTVGYSRDVTVGVWVGNFDRTPLRDSTGVTGAGPIFHAVMLAARRRAVGSHAAWDAAPIVPRPAGLEQREVCALSGMAANAWCPSRIREWMAPGGRPPCSWHHFGDEGLLTIWPVEYRQWAQQNGIAPERRPAETRLPVVPAREPLPVSGRAALEITTPPRGAVYLIDPTLRREFQTVSLRALASRAGQIEWSIDGRAIGSTPSDTALAWPLAPGTHQLIARDGAGNSASTSFVVK